MLAVNNETKQPDTKALNATFVIDVRRDGASTLSAPIKILKSQDSEHVSIIKNCILFTP